MTKNVKGFPRPTLSRSGKNTPVPYVGGNKPYVGQWQGIDDKRAIECDEHELCIICGLERGDNWVYALMHGKSFDHRGNPWGVVLGLESPSPTFGHPKCILLAALYCPHLKSKRWPAKGQNGNKLTVEDLKELVQKEKKCQI